MLNRSEILPKAKRIQRSKQHLRILQYNLLEELIYSEDDLKNYIIIEILEEIINNIAIINLLLKAYQEYLNIFSRT